MSAILLSLVKITIPDAELILLQQVILQYLHYFLVCECWYANQMHALWITGLR